MNPMVLTISEIIPESYVRNSKPAFMYQKNRSPLPLEPINFNAYVSSKLANVKNIALQHSDQNVCLFGMPCFNYPKNFLNTIIELHKKNKEIDIIIFPLSLNNNDTIANLFFQADKELVLADLLHLKLFEISFKTDRIRKKALFFDTEFGKGAQFPFYQNIIFLSDAIKLGLRVLWVPHLTVLHQKVMIIESRFQTATHESLGAALCKIYGMSHVHTYFHVFMQKLELLETERQLSWQTPLYKMELLLKGAYQYQNHEY